MTDPFGRSATFTYNGNLQLASITDTLGITSRFSYLYDSGDFIDSLTTPYGTSTFTYGDSTTDYNLGNEEFVTITDPLGQTERVEYNQAAPGITDTDPPDTVPKGMNVLNEYLTYRDTFVWDKHQYALANLGGGSLDYTKATIMHWLHTPGFGSASAVLESVKEPLENRVWFNYPGQTNPIEVGTSNLPSAIGRVLDDGTTQLQTFDRNTIGHITQFTDPIGRQLTMTYDPSGIDLLSLANTTGGANQLLVQATYGSGNSQHEPLTVTDAAGQVTKYSYNGAGQVMSTTDATGATTNFKYTSSGLLSSILRPVSAADTAFTYDSLNRPSSLTDSLSYKLLFTYDTDDRLIGIKYPDSSSTTYVYKLLDLASVTDRLRRTTGYTYDKLRRLIAVKDPLGHSTTYGYCDCDSVSQVTDPNGHSTSIAFDLEERPVGEMFADGSESTATYQLTNSRLASVTDALRQVTAYTYNEDDTLSSIAYNNAVNATAGVTVKWDPNFARIVSFTDGSGTSTYTYNPIGSTPALGAGLASSVTGPDGDTVSYVYDALGRTVRRTVDGSAANLTFDGLGRVASDSNTIDKFSFSYLGGTRLPVSIKSTHGLSSLYTYLGTTGDERVATITNESHAGNLISSFQYKYDAGGDPISTVIQKQFTTPVTRTMSYDLAGELLGVASTGGGNSFQYTYDPGSNITSSKVGTTTTSFVYNKTNEITSPGPATYDADGQPLKLGAVSFQWHAAHRLISASSGTQTTRFAYDGLGRRIGITQLSGSKVASDKYYFWCGSVLCLETNATNHDAVTQRYFPEGVVQNGQSFYYGTDNLGSIRDLVDQTGTVQASYDYSPYGTRTKLLGAEDSDFGYAGLFHESQSGLDLAFYRAYQSGFGRWLNRDPLGVLIEPAGPGRSLILSVTAPLSSGYWPYGFQRYYNLHGNGTGGPAPLYSAITATASLGAALVGQSLAREGLNAVAAPNLYAYVQNAPFDMLDPTGLCPPNWGQVGLGVLALGTGIGASLLGAPAVGIPAALMGAGSIAGGFSCGGSGSSGDSSGGVTGVQGVNDGSNNGSGLGPGGFQSYAGSQGALSGNQ